VARTGGTLLLIGYVMVASTGLVALSVLAHLQQRFFFDLPATQLVQSWRGPILDRVMAAISWPGYPPQWLLLFGVVAGILVVAGWRLEAAILALAELGVGVTGFILKPIVDRQRPPSSLVWIGDGANVGSDHYTYTAGHVHTAVVMFGWVSYLVLVRLQRGSRLRRLTIAVSVAILVLTGISRVYLGDHWLSDVLGGYLLGSIWLGLEILYHRLLADPTRRLAARVARAVRARIPRPGRIAPRVP
jgi:undecaprenyl-diphosphatase